MEETEFQKQQLAEFKKECPDGNWWDYQDYCRKRFEKEQCENLEKYKERNFLFLKETGNLETFQYLVNHNKTAPVSMSRREAGDKKFDFYLCMSGWYNTLLMELSRNELQREHLLKCFEVVKQKNEKYNE